MRLYKVTNISGQTRGGTRWGEGVEHAAAGPEGQELCTDGWIHAYESQLVTTFVWRAHVGFVSPRLWEAEGDVGITDGLKVGCRRLRTLREIPWPAVTTEHYVRFAIACAWVTASDGWKVWARKWLSGEDRSRESAAMNIGMGAAAVYAAEAARAAAEVTAAEKEVEEKAQASHRKWIEAEIARIKSETAQAATAAAWVRAEAEWVRAMRVARAARELVETETAKATEVGAAWTNNNPDFSALAEWALTTSTKVPVV